MINTLKELDCISGVCGNEQRVREYLTAAVSPYADEVWHDSMGNLYARKKGSGPRVMISAHMDEIGMMVTGIRDDGFIAYDHVGIDARMLIGKRVLIGDQNVPGIIGVRVIHLQSQEQRKKAYKHDEIFIDIGATSKDDAQQCITLGDHIGFSPCFESFGHGLIKGKSLDSRMGCAILIELLKNKFDCDLYAVFTVQEKLEGRGMEAAVYNVSPKLAVVLGAAQAKPLPGSDGIQYGARVGAGPAIVSMSKNAITPPILFDVLISAADEAGIRRQTVCDADLISDSGPLHKSLSGCLCGCIAIPLRYANSPCSVAAEGDYFDTYKLIKYFMIAEKYKELPI